MNREQWLIQATLLLESELFKQHGHNLPKIRVSIGFTGGGSPVKKIGSHWHADATDDKVPSIFISPIVGDSIEILSVLVHELVHAVYPNDGHGKLFRKLALAVGLEGKMTATNSGPKLKEYFSTITKRLGEIPHSKLNLNMRKKQTTRMIKLECEACGCIVRISEKWLSEVGEPYCGCRNGNLIRVPGKN